MWRHMQSLLLFLVLILAQAHYTLADRFEHFEVREATVSVWEGGISTGDIADRRKFFNEVRQLISKRLHKRGIKTVESNDAEPPNLSFLLMTAQNPAFPNARAVSVHMKLRDSVILKRKSDLVLYPGHGSIYDTEAIRLVQQSEVETALKDLTRVCIDRFESND